MKCPNCGKEAINVNGRYVCLDCGVELTSSGTPTTPPPVISTVDNHGAAFNVPADSAVGASEPAPVTATPIISPSFESNPPAPLPTTPDVAASTVAVNPSQAQSQPPAEAETPAPTDSPAPDSGPETLPNESQSVPSPNPAEPVKDYYLNQLDHTDENGPQESVSSAAGAVVPDFPEVATAPDSVPEVPQNTSTSPLPTDQSENPVGMSSEPVQPEPFAPHDVSSNVPAPEPVAPADVPLPPVETPTPTLAEATVGDQTSPTGEAANFFQPSSLDLNAGPSDSPVPAQPAWDHSTENTVAPEAEAAPTEQDSVPTPENGSVEIPINTNPSTEFSPSTSGNGPVVDPLDQVEPVVPDSAAEAPASFPGTSNIPSAESVFGPTGETSTPAIDVPKKSSQKLWLWILLGVLGFLLLLGGGIYAYTLIFPHQSSSGQQGQIDNGTVLTISANVGDTMDKSTDVATTFEETLDFSKATPKDSSQALFFSTPQKLTETWTVDAAQDISIDAAQNTVPAKRVYIKADDATYVYSNDAKVWVKTLGQNLSPASVFFPIDSRGSLFYLTRIDSLTDKGTEEVNKVEAKKYQISPKKEAIEDLLTAANPDFAKINYNNLDLSGLTILAWVNPQNNQILKVTANGSVDVSADLYNGEVGINASGTYVYKTQAIAKP